MYRIIAEKILKFKLILILTPNMITASSFLLLALIIYLMYIRFNPFIIAILFQLFILTDYLDGTLAREKNQSSILGEYLEFFHHSFIRIALFIIIPAILNLNIWVFSSLSLFFSFSIYSFRKIYQSSTGKTFSVVKKENGLLPLIISPELTMINLFCLMIILKQISLYYIIFCVYGTLYMIAQTIIYLIKINRIKRKS